MIRVLIVADVMLFRSALAIALDSVEEFEVVGEATGAEAVAMAGEIRPDVAVIDLDARRASPFTVVSTLTERCPECRIVALTAVAAPQALRRALHSRVLGFVGKDSGFDRLVVAVCGVAAGERVIEASVALAALSRLHNPLTVREMEVLRLVADGLPVEDIAGSAHLTCGTVRNYLSSTMRKLGARNRLEAVRTAREAGWL